MILTIVENIVIFFLIFLVRKKYFKRELLIILSIKLFKYLMFFFIRVIK